MFSMRPERGATASPEKACRTVAVADGTAIGMARAPVRDVKPASVAIAATVKNFRGLIGVKISMLISSRPIRAELPMLE
jgi:hypothetical protein